MTTPDDRVLWTMVLGDKRIECVMISCCSGAELQVRGDGEPLLRELYPDKSTLYERARQLQAERDAAGWRAAP